MYGVFCFPMLGVSNTCLARRLRSRLPSAWGTSERSCYNSKALDLTLLNRVAPSVVREMPEASLRLVHLEGLPLAIRVAGRLLASETALGIDPHPLLLKLPTLNGTCYGPWHLQLLW